jgi:hypothetical protein
MPRTKTTSSAIAKAREQVRQEGYDEGYRKGYEDAVQEFIGFADRVSHAGRATTGKRPGKPTNNTKATNTRKPTRIRVNNPEQRILDVLTKSGAPMTRSEIANALKEAGTPFGDSNLSNRLSDMRKAKKLDNKDRKWSIRA